MATEPKEQVLLPGTSSAPETYEKARSFLLKLRPLTTAQNKRNKLFLFHSILCDGYHRTLSTTTKQLILLRHCNLQLLNVALYIQPT